MIIISRIHSEIIIITQNTWGMCSFVGNQFVANNTDINFKYISFYNLIF